MLLKVGATDFIYHINSLATTKVDDYRAYEKTIETTTSMLYSSHISSSSAACIIITYVGYSLERHRLCTVSRIVLI